MKYLLCLLLLINAAIQAQTDTNSPIIYGYKDGMALTMHQLPPAGSSNGKAVIQVINGFWVSDPQSIPFFSTVTTPFRENGYTVFLVLTSSQPRYAIPEQVKDLQRAIRFIRYHAADYGINSNQIGISGASSGGQLALVAATANADSTTTSADPVDKVSARVQAAAIFFPPTDFLNYGIAGNNVATDAAFLRQIKLTAAFDFQTFSDTYQQYVPVSSTDRLTLARQLSPVYAVSPDDPPVIIAHGDKDQLVPLQQSQVFIEALKKAGVPNKLLIRKEAGHGWPDASEEMKQFVDWFNQYLQ
ncbi:MAG: alpha/beta hydrolase [Candidatus Pseudobacter hemicellulosilyticus]|uniref:Alpha/beta hydrolase n=1 Tax=Candidatus Pseudobacter hemicellulosilyticus TaxID=3121375 RepID=A0AAJ5WVZ0_9BACT|nr:MAG: alpha/beta hydrolase [Pseudobacter sp.]